MIRIKDITWVEVESRSYDGYKNHSGIVRNISFLTIIQYSVKPAYYIHPTLPIFKTQGNQGIDKWGMFGSLDECKRKCEEIITNEILSFIDMRDYKVNTILEP